MRAFLAPLLCALTLLAGCGEDAEPAGGDGPPGTGPKRGASLKVSVWPRGRDGPVRRRRIDCRGLGAGASKPICRRLGGLTPASFAPVPHDVACTEIYGGPAVARVRGTLRGTRIDARLNRVDGCEIERWDRNRVLLGRASTDVRP